MNKKKVKEDIDNLISEIEEKCPACGSLLQPLDNEYYLCTYCHRMFRGSNKEEVKSVCIREPRWS